MDTKTLDSIRMLRSVHDDFNEREILQEDMDKIIDYSMKAANASNLQRYSMILLDNSELIQEITSKRTAKKAIIYCLDYNRIINTAKYTGHQYSAGVDNWYDIISGIFDVAALAQTAVITAKALGIDTLITNGVLRQDQRIVRERLNLPPKYCIAVMAVLFGYCDTPWVETKNRLSAEYIVHKNQYKEVTVEEYSKIVQEYDMINPEHKSEKYPHYVDWFYEEWCKPFDQKCKSDLYQVMLEAGFQL
jgi:nitroreductase